jgi:hypothetical protein
LTFLIDDVVNFA